MRARDKVWVRFKFTGRHTGEYRGLAPTDKKIRVEAVDIFRMVDGKAVEEWEVSDRLDFLKQLGAIEYTGFLDEVKQLHSFLQLKHKELKVCE